MSSSPPTTALAGASAPLEAGGGERVEVSACYYDFGRWDFAIRALKEDMK